MVSGNRLVTKRWRISQRHADSRLAATQGSDQFVEPRLENLAQPAGRRRCQCKPAAISEPLSESRMHRKHGLPAIVVAATVFAAGASDAAAPSASVNVAAADNAFGFRLLNGVQKTIPSHNVVL